MQSTWRQAIQEKFDTLKKVEQVKAGSVEFIFVVCYKYLYAYMVYMCGGVAFVYVGTKHQSG